jgi:hypothetical protein
LLAFLNDFDDARNSYKFNERQFQLFQQSILLIMLDIPAYFFFAKINWEVSEKYTSQACQAHPKIAIGFLIPCI